MPNNYILLETIALTQTAASVTFDNLPTSGYTDLKVVISARYSGSPADGQYIAFNGSTANFSGRYLIGDGSAASSGVLARYAGTIGGTASTANTFNNTEIYIPNYRSSANKSFSVDNVSENNATLAYANLIAGLWSNTAAITSIELTPATGNFVANSTFSLYGVAALGTTPVLAPKATGGNRIENDGTYWIHTFLTSGVFTPQTGLNCDYLVVAGGGGANTVAEQSGGGGGGGLRSTVTATGGGGSLESPISVASGTNYAITVGAGGAVGSSGSDSIFSTITSTGGGYGGARIGTSPNTAVGGNGGSSGGGGDFGGQPGTRTASPVQGYNGGTGSGDSGGGGGGAGGAGGNSSGPTPGAGGAQLAISITGTSVNYAGGGIGGDAAAGAVSPVNSGKGGDAGPHPTSRAGGSGIVIIRYPIN